MFAMHHMDNIYELEYLCNTSNAAKATRVRHVGLNYIFFAFLDIGGLLRNVGESLCISPRIK